MNLSEIKIVIIEDSERDLCAINQALCKLKKNNSDCIKKDNITNILINSSDDLNLAVSKIISANPDILFIDLHLVESINDGTDLIDNLMNLESSLKYIPKYIISGADKVFENDDYRDLFQYAYPIIKPDSKNLEGSSSQQCDELTEDYYNIFEAKHKLNKTLPLLASMYRIILDKFEITTLLKAIRYKVDEEQIKSEDILKYLQLQEKIIDKIDITTKDIKEKVILVEIITKSIAKALPKITDKTKAKKLIDEWGNNIEFQNAMGSYFPELPTGLYNAIKEGFSNIVDNSTEDISKLLYDAGKTYINTNAGIEKDDDKMIALMKYSAYFTEKVSDIVLKK